MHQLSKNVQLWTKQWKSLVVRTTRWMHKNLQSGNNSFKTSHYKKLKKWIFVLDLPSCIISTSQWFNQSPKRQPIICIIMYATSQQQNPWGYLLHICIGGTKTRHKATNTKDISVRSSSLYKSTCVALNRILPHDYSPCMSKEHVCIFFCIIPRWFYCLFLSLSPFLCAHFAPHIVRFRNTCWCV